MDWRTASFAVLALWGSYMIFGSKAIAIHGEHVTMFFEGSAMMFMAILGIIGYTGDFAKMTMSSGSFALVMGLMSAVGLYIQLYALRVAPSPDVIPTITMITGSWPVVTVVLAVMFLGSRLQYQQWFGVVMVAAGLFLVNWKR